jgi:hypothetical protein
MAKVIGGGNYNATQCLRVDFSEALSTAPKLEAWDNVSAYPVSDALGATTANELFTGTAGNGNIPMLACWSGGQVSAPVSPGASWHPASATAGSANPNLLEGSTSFVTATVMPAALGNIIYNLSFRVPSDATVPSASSMAFLMQVRYTYTGLPPVLSFRYNNAGTEGTPIWTVYTAGSEGVRFANIGTVGAPFKLTLPAAGQLYAGELWVTSN